MVAHHDVFRGHALEDGGCQVFGAIFDLDEGAREFVEEGRVVGG